jgi:hypothetical protein
VAKRGSPQPVKQRAPCPLPRSYAANTILQRGRTFSRDRLTVHIARASELTLVSSGLGGALLNYC